MAPKKTKTAKVAEIIPKKSKKVPVEESEDSSEEESSEDEEMPEVPVKTKKVGKAVAKKDSSEDEDDSDDDEEDSDEEAPAPKKTKAVAADSDEDESDDDDSEEDDSDDATTKKNGKKNAKAPVSAKKGKADEESDEEDDSEEEDSDEEEASEKKNGKEEEESDDDEDDDDSEEDESDEDDDSPKSGKRKKEKGGPPAKKAKVEETVTLYVGNIGKDWDTDRIKKFFTKKGISVSDCRKMDKKAFAYVDLEDASQLEVGLALNGETYKSCTLKIEQAKTKLDADAQKKVSPKKTAQRGGGDGKEYSLFVKNLAATVTKDMLMEQFPGANDCYIPTHPGTEDIKGFAYVRYSSEDMVKSAIDEKQGLELEGQSLFLDAATPRPDRNNTPRGGGGRGGRGGRGGFGGGGDRRSGSFGEAGKTKTLIVKSLSYDTDKDSLRNAFSGCTRSYVCEDRESGRSRGFGFVSFSTTEECQQACESMNGQSIDGRKVFCDYSTDRDNAGGGGGGGGGRGGFRGGRGGDRGRGGRGGGRGRGGGGFKKEGITDFKGSRKTFDDSD